MRQLELPFYQPCFPASERTVLTLLHAALRVVEHTLRDEHPLVEDAPKLAEHHAPIVVVAAKLIADRCAELQGLLDFYDAALDDVIALGDDAVPF